MRWQVICVGRKAADPLLEAAAAYEARLRRYAQLSVVRLREGTPQSETRSIRAALVGRGGYTFACDEAGPTLSTAALAARLRALQQRALPQVAFVVGGASGLPPEVRAGADGLLALSALTLPHRLALVTLLEQLYRVHTIWRGERYHRA